MKRTCCKCLNLFNLDNGDNCDISAYYNRKENKFYLMGGYYSCCDNIYYEVILDDININNNVENDNNTNNNCNDVNDKNSRQIKRFRMMFPFFKTCENIYQINRYTFNDNENNENCENGGNEEDEDNLSNLCDKCFKGMIYKKEIRYSHDRDHYQSEFMYPFYTDCCDELYEDDNKGSQAKYWMRISRKKLPYCNVVIFEDVTTHPDYEKDQYNNTFYYLHPNAQRKPWFRNRAIVCTKCFDEFVNNKLILDVHPLKEHSGPLEYSYVDIHPDDLQDSDLQVCPIYFNERVCPIYFNERNPNLPPYSRSSVQSIRSEIILSRLDKQKRVSREIEHKHHTKLLKIVLDKFSQIYAFPYNNILNKISVHF